MATGRPGILYAQNLFWLDDSCLERGFMLITLTTDFGHRDPFVGIMKGVIAGINPKAQVIDLTHGIPPQDVMAAALALRHSVAYFPRDSIHVVVVDPGVGGSRRPLLIESAGNYFIGPDNGVLSLATAAAESLQVFELSNPDYRLEPTSATFHGRDIFAPAAAHLSLGVRRLPLAANWLHLLSSKCPKSCKVITDWKARLYTSTATATCLQTSMSMI